jgi:hypothetical protein
MHQICLVLPVRMGRTSLVRRLVHQLDHDGLDAGSAAWYLAATPLGDLLIAYLELESETGLGAWLTAGLGEAAALDGSAATPELLGSWQSLRHKEEAT